MNIPFGDYRPDGSDLGPHATVATGVFPDEDGYRQAPTMVAISATAISANAFGMFSAHSIADADINIVASPANLWEYDFSTRTDVSRPGGYTALASETLQPFWEFTKFNNYILAVNGADATFEPVQQYEMDSSTTFTDVAGAPNAAHIATVGDFVVLGDTWDSVDGRRHNRVRWSAIGDHTSWTVNATTQADFQDLSSGMVSAVVGGEFGLVITESGTWRMSYIGSPLVFQFDEVLPEVSTRSPASVVRVGNSVFLWSEDGFRVIENGSSSRLIGKGRVDATAKAGWGDINRVVGVRDPTGSRIIWGAPKDSPWLCYDWALDRWSTMSVATDADFSSISYLGPARAILSTNKAYLVAMKTVGVVNGNFFVMTDESGTTKQPVTIRSAFSELAGGRHAVVNRVLPVADDNAPTVNVRTVNVISQSSPDNYTETLHTGTGSYTMRADGRYHSFEVVASATSTNPGIFRGVNVDSVKARGLR